MRFRHAELSANNVATLARISVRESRFELLNPSGAFNRFEFVPVQQELPHRRDIELRCTAGAQRDFDAIYKSLDGGVARGHRLPVIGPALQRSAHARRARLLWLGVFVVRV